MYHFELFFPKELLLLNNEELFVHIPCLFVHSPGCPWIHYVAQAFLEITAILFFFFFFSLLNAGIVGVCQPHPTILCQFLKKKKKIVCAFVFVLKSVYLSVRAGAVHSCVQAWSVLSLSVPVNQGFSVSLGLTFSHLGWKHSLGHLPVPPYLAGITVMHKIPSLLDGCGDPNSSSYNCSASCLPIKPSLRPFCYFLK